MEGKTKCCKDRKLVCVEPYMQHKKNQIPELENPEASILVPSWNPWLQITQRSLIGIPSYLPHFVDGSVQTVVSFDQGGEWVPLQKPENSKCDSTAKDKDVVRGTSQSVTAELENFLKNVHVF